MECPKCGQTLSIVYSNSQIYIPICINERCQDYRNLSFYMFVFKEYGERNSGAFLKQMGGNQSCLRKKSVFN